MSSEPNKVRSIFLAAVENCTPNEWDAYLDQACEGDDNVRRRVEVLLKAHLGDDSLLDASAPASRETMDVPSPLEGPGTVIGPYKLMEQIGEGGMGLVFVAEQQQPVRRKVALKVIKPGMDTRQVIARFEAERQALALMDHPNIAKVLEAGATESGRPYFVMELVKGVPITQFCDDNRQSPRERLQLFIDVCAAVQHAHHKGVIHRDIKPSNVMITLYDGKPVPKVIDFGVAKATEQKLTERTLFTQYGTMVGTLEYMSPEQAEVSALGVDTRSDIYSLGVLLYELLTGSTPLTHKRMKEAAYAEILRMIKEEEPPKPSTRLSDSGEALASISANRHTEPAKLTKLVKGELDWIVMKTLEKDRNRRYETANGLAMDVQRYLNDEPVQACPPSVGYRLRKFARRNKRAVMTAALLGLALVVAFGAVAGSVGWVVRDRSARLKETERQVAPLLDDAAAAMGKRSWPDARIAITRAEGLLASGEAPGELRQRIQQLRTDLDMVARLEEIRLQQAEVRDGRFHNTGTDPAYAQALADYGIEVERLEASDAAERIRRSSIGLELAAALDDWARVRRVKPDAGPLSWKVLLAVARSADPDPQRNRVRDALERGDRKTLEDMADAYLASANLPPPTVVFLASDLAERGAAPKAAALLQKAQQQHPADFWINHNLGYCLSVHMQPPRLEEAIRYYSVAVALRPESPGAYLNYGTALAKHGLLDEAIAAHRRAIALKKDYAEAYGSLGIALRKKGLLDEAIAAYRKAMLLKPEDPFSHNNLGLALRHKGRPDEAIAAFQEALRLRPSYINGSRNLGDTLLGQGKVDEAIAEYRKAVALSPEDAEVRVNLGVALRRLGKLDEAIVEFRKASELKPDLAVAHYNLGNTFKDQHKFDEAIAAYRKAIACRKAIEQLPAIAAVHYVLGAALHRKGRLDEAITSYRKSIELKPTDGMRYILASALQQMGKTDEAIAACKEAILLNPADQAACDMLGGFLDNAKHYDAALAAFREVIRLKPTDLRPRLNLCRALENNGKAGEAIAEYKEAICLEPKRAIVYVHLAFLLANCPDAKWRNPAEAVAAARKAVELWPNNDYPWQALGWALYRAGDWQASIDALNKSVELEKGGDPAQWFFLAMAHWKLNQKEEARKWFDRAVEWMDKTRTKHEGLRRFRAEAAELLGIEKKKD